jgi:virginiamycin B lyase
MQQFIASAIRDLFKPQSSSTKTKSRFWFNGCGSLAAACSVAAILSAGSNDVVAQTVIEYPQVPTQLAGVCEQEFDRLGNLWIEEFIMSKMARMNPATGQITEFPLPVAAAIPGGIELGWDGGIWLEDITGNSVIRLEPSDGSFQFFQVPFPNALGVLPSSLPYGTGQQDDITKGADGAMWFSLPGINAVGRIDLTTHEITKYQIPSGDIPTLPNLGVDGVFHIITHGPNNTIIFGEPLTNKIGTINVYTKEFVEYPVPTPAALPAGTAETADGAIWFTETGAHAFGRLDPTTGAIVEYDMLKLRNSPLPPGIGNPIPTPVSIKLGGDGNLYISEIPGGAPTLTNVIARYNPNTGEFVEIPTPTPLSSPDCDANNQHPNQLWFSEVVGNKLAEIPLTSQDPASIALLKKWSGF